MLYRQMWRNSPDGPVPAEVDTLLLGFVDGRGRLPSGRSDAQKAADRSLFDGIRSRGGNIGLSFGGEGYPLDFAYPNAIVAGLRETVAQIGPVAWIDYDMESNLPSAARINAVTAAIRAEWPNMKFSCAPGGGVIEQWYRMFPELGLDAVFHQYYDNPDIQLRDILWRIKLAKQAGVPEVGLGTKVQYRDEAAWAETIAAVHEVYPDVRSAYVWEIGSQRGMIPMLVRAL